MKSILQEKADRPYALPVIGLTLAATFLVLVGYQVERLRYQTYLQRLQMETTVKLVEVRENVEKEVFNGILAIQGVGSLIERNPDISRDEFSQKAEDISSNNASILNIAAAPDLVVEMVYPVERNSAAIGLNYRETPEQIGEVLRAIESKTGTISGRVNLVQGGEGLVIRQPVFLDGVGGRDGELWGVVSIVLDYQQFLLMTGLVDAAADYDLLLASQIPGGKTEVIFGEPGVADQQPVRLDFNFPYGLWVLSATTKGGWPSRQPGFLRDRFIMLFVGGSLLSALAFTFYLSEARRRVTAQLSGALEALNDGFVLFDKDERLVVSNSKYREIYKYAAQGMTKGARFEDIVRTGRGLGQTFSKDGREEEWIEARLKAFRAGTTNTLQHMPDGRYIRVTDRRMPDGGFAGLRVDVTELEVAKEAAEAANKAKTEFIGTLSHELRTPLTVILGNVRLAKNIDKLPPAIGLTKALNSDHGISENTRARAVDLMSSVSQVMAKLERSSVHLLSLVNEMLDFAKIESGTIQIDAKVCDIEEIVRPIEEQLREEIERKGLDFIVISPGGKVFADEIRARQILFNLIGNAIKFTSEGHISLTVEVSENEVVFSVADTGLGISPDELDRVFEAFHQVDASYQKKTGGTGLGLAISRKLAEAQNGYLSATSELGKGSTFVLVLPRRGSGPAVAGYAPTKRSAR